MEHGPNFIAFPQNFSLVKLFLAGFTNILSVILIIAGIISFLLRDNIDGSFILIIVILNAALGFIQEFRAHRSILALRQLLTNEVRVLRGNKEVIIPAENLVPGNIVILDEGDKIPADGKLIHGTHLEVDESILTGESIPVLKQTKGENKLFMSTTIVSGRGRMQVLAIGLDTNFGKIAKSLAEIEEDKTPLQIQLSQLGRNLAIGIGIVGVIIFITGFLQQRELFTLLLTSISVAVAAIPEGLPAVITIALALGMERMAKKRSIVRKLASIETLGAIQVLLIDKTGTITRNQMEVKKVWHAKPQLSDFMLRAAILGNSATLVEKDGGDFDIVGDKTDGALLVWAKNLAKFESVGQIVDEYAFDPVTRTISIVWKKDSKIYTLIRGAPESILFQASINTEEHKKISSKVNKFAKAGLRVIGFGYKEKKSKKLTFLGLVGIYDPPRVEAKEALRIASLAGIRVVMVTGDNEVTAEAIGKEVRLVKKDEYVIKGQDLEKMTESQLDQILLKTRIFARVTPSDKLRIVEAYQKKGFVVGVSGDGVNDALALKRANVGVAMGQTGTDVAKEASDMVITDDNFATIVKAIEEGRTIYDNIVKSVIYLLSCNLAEIGTLFLAIILKLPLPLLPTQILWMNLVTDSLPALALAADTKDPEVLKRLPRSTKDYILNPARTSFLIVSGAIISILTIAIFYISLQNNGEVVARTAAFTFLVVAQMVQAFVVRGAKNPFSNKFLIAAVGVTIILQILILTVPSLRTIFHVV